MRAFLFDLFASFCVCSFFYLTLRYVYDAPTWAATGFAVLIVLHLRSHPLT